MSHIITPAEVGQLSRPISKHIDTDAVQAYIREAEELDIRPVLGDRLFLDVLLKPTKPQYKRLLDGWTPYRTFDTTADDTFGAENERRFTAGLKSCLAYYVLARIFKNNDLQLTRFGVVRKDGEYSEKPDRSEKRNQYGEICAIADNQLAQIRAYLREYPKRYPLYMDATNNPTKKVLSNRTKFKPIGQ